MMEKNYAKLDCLPQEILDNIIEKIPRTRDRANLCKVSRELHNALLPALYSSWSYDKIRHSIYSLQCFVRTVLIHPHLATYIKTLDCGTGPYIWPSRFVSVYEPEICSGSEIRQEGLQYLPLSMGSIKHTQKQMNELNEDFKVLEKAHEEMGFSKDEIEKLFGKLRSLQYRRSKITTYRDPSSEPTMNKLLLMLMSKLPNLKTISITANHQWLQDIPSSLAFVFDPSFPLSTGRKLEQALYSSLNGLQTLKIYNSTKYNKMVSNTFILWPFLHLPNLRSVYTLGLIQYIKDTGSISKVQDNDVAWRREIEKHSSFSSVTGIALDSGLLRITHTQTILRGLKTLERFRWTHNVLHGYTRYRARDQYLTTINMLRPYADTLQEIDLRFYLDTCRRDPEYLLPLGSLVQFQILESLTIDPAVLGTRKLGVPIPSNMEDVLPNALKHLGLVYPSGHSNSTCNCRHKDRRQVWEVEVINLAIKIGEGRALPLLRNVDVICMNKDDDIDNAEVEERDQLFEDVKAAFTTAKVSCLVSHFYKNDNLAPFRTADGIRRFSQAPGCERGYG